jgi:pimeloyl-ACP methyl ester carboxylesterase
MDRLAERYRVIAPAHPGFAGSTGIEHIDDPVDMAVFCNDLLDELGVDSADVIGHELGGMFAAEFAAMSPARVRKLVLVAPLGLRAEGVEAVDIFAGDPAAIPALLWHDPTSSEAKAFDALPKDGDALQEETILRGRASASASRFVWPFPERGLRKRIHRVKAPTLIIWGSSDGFTPPALARPFLEALHGSQLVTIANAGHFPMLEQREAFESAVSAFLD